MPRLPADHPLRPRIPRTTVRTGRSLLWRKPQAAKATTRTDTFVASGHCDQCAMYMARYSPQRGRSRSTSISMTHRLTLGVTSVSRSFSMSSSHRRKSLRLYRSRNMMERYPVQRSTVLTRPRRTAVRARPPDKGMLTGGPVNTRYDRISGNVYLNPIPIFRPARRTRHGSEFWERYAYGSNRNNRTADSFSRRTRENRRRWPLSRKHRRETRPETLPGRGCHDDNGSRRRRAPALYTPLTCATTTDQVRAYDGKGPPSLSGTGRNRAGWHIGLPHYVNSGGRNQAGLGAETKIKGSDGNRLLNKVREPRTWRRTAGTAAAAERNINTQAQNPPAPAAVQTRPRIRRRHCCRNPNTISREKHDATAANEQKPPGRRLPR